MRVYLMVWMVVWTATSAVLASGRIVVTGGVEGDITDPTLSAGDLIVIPFSTYNEGREGICGASLDLAVRGDAVQIRSVTFAPAFSYVLSEGGEGLPGWSYHTERAQPFGSLDRTLGADGTDVPLVTVELEVLSPDMFRSGLKIDVRGATIGRLVRCGALLRGPRGVEVREVVCHGLESGRA